MTIPAQRKILHAFIPGLHVHEFIQMARRLGYDQIELNGVVYLLSPTSNRLMDAEYFGIYEDIFGESTP